MLTYRSVILTMEATLEQTEVTQLEQIDWDFETAKLQCSLDNPESCEMCQG